MIQKKSLSKMQIQNLMSKDFFWHKRKGEMLGEIQVWKLEICKDNFEDKTP